MENNGPKMIKKKPRYLQNTFYQHNDVYDIREVSIVLSFEFLFPSEKCCTDQGRTDAL